MTGTSGGTIRSMKNTYAKTSGFTIVELLIVIVVIAILAAVSIAAYTNIQQRAKNAVIINAASQSLKMIKAYIAENGDYPMKVSGDGYACITTETGCRIGGGTTAPHATFDSNVKKIGLLPRNVPAVHTDARGLRYEYGSYITYNGESQPASLFFYLAGKSKCELPGVMMQITSSTFESSTIGYSMYEITNDRTSCKINIPGPASS